LGRIFLELRTKHGDVYVNSARVRVALVTPDAVQQIVARNDLAGLRGQEPQNAVFLSSQFHRLAAFDRFAPAKVHDDVIEANLVRKLSRVLVATQQGADARQELPGRKPHRHQIGGPPNQTGDRDA